MYSRVYRLNVSCEKLYREKPIEKKAAPTALLYPNEAFFTDFNTSSRLLNLFTKLNQWLVGTKEITPNTYPKGFKGRVLDLRFDGGKNKPYKVGQTKMIPVANLRSLMEKSREAEVLSKAIPEYFPKTIPNLLKALEKANIDPSDQKAVSAYIKKQLGNVQWIAKPSSGGEGTLEEFPTSVRQLHSLYGPTADVLVQTRKKFAKIHPLQRKIDKLLMKVFPGLAERNTGKIGNNIEYRVHALNGKVVRNGTVMRSSLIGSLFPFQTKNTEKINGFAQNILKQMSSKGYGKYSKGLLALDIGIDAKGNPFVIELNPALMSKPWRNTPITPRNLHLSGFMVNSPWISEAVVSSGLNQTPLMQNVERGAKVGVAGIAGLGGAAYLSSSKDQNRQKV